MITESLDPRKLSAVKIAHQRFEVGRGTASLKHKKVKRRRLAPGQDGKTGMSLPAVVRLMIE